MKFIFKKINKQKTPKKIKEKYQLLD